MKRFGLLPRIILAIILGVAVGSIAPIWIIRSLSTFNGLFGNFLSFAIPLIIVGFIAPGIGTLGRGAGKLLGVTTGAAYLSTIIAGVFAFIAAKTFYPALLANETLKNIANPEESLLEPFFVVEMPPVMGVMTALLLAFTLGIGMAVIKGETLQNVMIEFRTIIEKVIEKIIIPFLPIHIFGIFANMTKGGQVGTILAVFSKVFVMVIILHLLFLLFQYTTAGAVSKQNPFKLLKQMAPAYFTALGTQSSAATIPVTLKQAKSLGAREKVADFSIPLLATIHLSGSTITLTSCAMAIMLLQGQASSFSIMMPFILMLGVTMVAAPGVPGGAVMAAIGLLETMLGFDQMMLSLMIALYLAQDSFGTACNVTGDGAITVISDKLSQDKSRSTLNAVSTN